MTNPSSYPTIEALKEAWTELKQQQPTLRIREAAKQLNTSEAQLLATQIGREVIRLEGDWSALFQRLPEMGRVMALTRNEACVLEHKGTFQKIEIMGNMPQAMATVIGPIESRVFFSAWKFGFAVKQESPRGLQQSLQFFDAAGEAITKIFLQDATAQRSGSNQEAYHQLVKEFTAAQQDSQLDIQRVPEAETTNPELVNKQAFTSDWAAMKDTHEFFGMIRKHQLNRQDALKLVEGEFTHRIQLESVENTLIHAAVTKLPIMIFVGNRGNIQIHQGKIVTAKRMDHWLNVLDPDFNMHLREDLIESVWVVKKPTSEGIVTSLELFDKDKNMIAQFFGLRKPGISELSAWTNWVAGLPLAESLAV